MQVELDTRITAQRLHYRSGDEETVVESVHALFPKTRELFVAHSGAAAFETAALFLLNRVLRPNTARWHRWTAEGKFCDEQSRRKFRAELQKLQEQLAHFEALLQSMIGGPAKDAEAKQAFAQLTESVPQPIRAADLGGAVKAGFATEVPVKIGGLHPSLTDANGQRETFAKPADMDRAERSFIHRRRAALAGERAEAATLAQPVENAAGVCLSGGGIRSATFLLRHRPGARAAGVVQALRLPFDRFRRRLSGHVSERLSRHAARHGIATAEERSAV